MHQSIKDACLKALASHPPRLLAEAAPPLLTKAGLLPFLDASSPEALRFLFMRPQGRHPQLGPPPLQICKGTRMIKPSGQEAWRDMRNAESLQPGDEIETLAETALREAVEETGLDLSWIMAICDLGVVSFASATSGKAKNMALFAALMHSADCLAPMAQIVTGTAERKWCTAAEFALSGRQDHIPIVQCALARLRPSQKEKAYPAA